MSDKMGNANVNGVQDQGSSEAVSKNASAEALVATYDGDELNVSEQQDTGHIVAERNPGHSVVSDYVDESNVSSSTTNIEGSNGNSKSDQSNMSATDNSLLNRQTSERGVSEQQESGHAIPNSSSNPSIDLDDRVNKYRSAPMEVSVTMEVEEFHQNASSGQSSTKIRDDVLTVRRTSESRVNCPLTLNLLGSEEEKASSVLSTTSQTNEAQSIIFIDPKSDELELNDGMSQESTSKSAKKWNSNTQIDEKSDKVEVTGTEGLFKCDSLDTSSALVESMPAVPTEERGPNEDMVLLAHGATEGNNNKDHKQLGLLLEIVNKDPKPSPKEDDLLTEQNSSIYLDYINFEINGLLSEDNSKTVDDSPETEPDMYNRSSSQAYNKGEEETSVKQLTINHRETHSHDFQPEEPSHEEDQESDVSDDSLTKAETDEIKEMKSEHKEQHDGNQTLMSSENHQDTKEKDILEKESMLQIDMLVVDEEGTKFRRNGSCVGKELVETNDTNWGRLNALPSPLEVPLVSINGDMVSETVDSSAKEKSSEELVIKDEESNEKTEILENNDSNRDGSSASFSYLLDLVDSASEEMTKKETEELEVTGNTTGRRAEQHDVAFRGHVPASDTTVSEVQTYQTNSVQTETENSPYHDSPQNKDLICTPEIELKHTTNESGALASNIVLITQTGGDIESINVPSEIARLVNESFVSTLEQENEEHVQEERTTSHNEVMIQATEVSKVECNETMLDSVMHCKNSEPEFTPVCPAPESVSAIFANESNQQKLNCQDDPSGLEILITEIVNAVPNQERADSKNESLFIHKIERCDHEAKEKSGSKIHAAEATAKEAKQNPSQYHEQTDNSENFIYEKCVPEINKDMFRCHPNVDHEVITMVGAEASVRVSESSNEESDKSPPMYKNCGVASKAPSSERTESGDLRAPFGSLLKEDVYAVEPFEKKECVDLQKPVEEVRRSPVKRITATTSRQKEKQKPRSSLFGNCMCF